MHTRAIVVSVSLALLAACGSNAVGTTTGTGGVTGTGTGTGATTGTGTTTTTASSGTGGTGGTGTTTTTGSGGTTTTTGSSGTTGTSGAGGSCATTPKFTEVLAQPLSGCAGLEPPCHNAGAGSLTIDPTKRNVTWAQLVNHATAMQGVGGVRVAPGDPANSFVYRKLTDDLGPNEGPPMPEPPGTLLVDGGWQELPSADIEMVRCWILGGAQND